MSVSKLAFIDARDTHVKKLEATQAELVSKVDSLQTLVRDLAAGNKVDHDYNSESSNANNRRPRCQLLGWYADVEVVVGEAEFCSADSAYKIGRIPLGPNAAAVVVTSVLKGETYVWRPTPTITSLGDAIGCKIAWPFDKIILENMNSPNGAAGSSAANALDERILIFDWIYEDELIAEGSLYSTDPKELVNNIPLGPNAAIVTVSKVVKDEAFLWRPSADLSVIGDALHEKIAWPIHKIQFILPQSRQQSVSKNASSKSASVSLSNSTDNSKGVKKKCILLDYTGTGVKVVEGRVSSTDPTHVVHFAPLGPNATSVWVEVPKVRDAPVLRPSSEIEIIADAVGTRIAWPNDKLVFI